MTLTVDYYFAPHSPWSYLGHRRFQKILKDAGAAVRVHPVDLGKVFPVSGGLPLAKRAPQRQAYRLVELRRYSKFLGMPMNVEPKYFPVSQELASRLIIAADLRNGPQAAMRVAGAALNAVWEEERDISDPQVMAALLREQKLSADLLDEAQSDEVGTTYDHETQAAIELGVFGAPSYVIDGEMFWGQDRLDFVQRRLESGT